MASGASRESFIRAAEGLENCYAGYGRALYALAKNHDCVGEVYEYLSSAAHGTGDVNEYVYELMGSPQPTELEIAGTDAGTPRTSGSERRFAGRAVAALG